jgi:hypothetical protein
VNDRHGQRHVARRFLSQCTPLGRRKRWMSDPPLHDHQKVYFPFARSGKHEAYIFFLPYKPATMPGWRKEGATTAVFKGRGMFFVYRWVSDPAFFSDTTLFCCRGSSPNGCSWLGLYILVVFCSFLSYIRVVALRSRPLCFRGMGRGKQQRGGGRGLLSCSRTGTRSR